MPEIRACLADHRNPFERTERKVRCSGSFVADRTNSSARQLELPRRECVSFRQRPVSFMRRVMKFGRENNALGACMLQSHRIQGDESFLK